jgi:alkyl hydroperoxide reductase subunit AhpC
VDVGAMEGRVSTESFDKDELEEGEVSIVFLHLSNFKPQCTTNISHATQNTNYKHS